MVGFCTPSPITSFSALTMVTFIGDLPHDLLRLRDLLERAPVDGHDGVTKAFHRRAGLPLLLRVLDQQHRNEAVGTAVPVHGIAGVRIGAGDVNELRTREGQVAARLLEADVWAFDGCIRKIDHAQSFCAMIRSTYCTRMSMPCVCEPLLPLLWTVVRLYPVDPEPTLPLPPWKSVIAHDWSRPWLWLGIVAVVSVVASVAVLPNTVENADEPPELAVPETTRSALSLCVVCFVQPVGALVCWNSISVPLSMKCRCDGVMNTSAAPDR